MTRSIIKSLLVIEVSIDAHRKSLKKTFDIYATLAKDLNTSHSFSQSPLILGADDLILAIQSPLRTSCHISWNILEILWLGVHKS